MRPSSLHDALKPVRSRQQTAFYLRAALWGVLAGSIAGALVGLGRMAFGFAPMPWQLSVGCLAGGVVLGLLFAAVVRRRWHDAAAAVDGHYGLKDRSVTALEFLNHPGRTDLHDLQIADAVDRLHSVEPQEVAPIFAPPKLAAAALFAMAVAILVFVAPLRQQEADAGPVPAPDFIVDEADKILESLQDLEDMAQREESQEFKDLVAELKKKTEELKEPGVDEREALAKLSEMQAAIQAQMDQYNPSIVDGQMQSLGNALASASAFEGAGKAMQEMKLEKAAEELENMEEVKLERNEAKALEEKLKQVAKEAGGAGMGSLSNAVADLADSVKDGKSRAKKSAKTLGKEVRNQARRKRVNDLLRAQFDRLKEGKCNCNNNSLVTGKNPQKSMNPSSNFGMSESGNTEGERTSLDSQRQQQQITGTAGEGPSDVETTSSPEARQQASRAYQDRYQKYRKESEAVLDSEPIPLGQRQVIRKYFELIRPQNTDMLDARPAATEADSK